MILRTDFSPQLSVQAAVGILLVYQDWIGDAGADLDKTLVFKKAGIESNYETEDTKLSRTCSEKSDL